MSALLEVRSLDKRFGGVRAVAGLSLDLAAGERAALIGPNGAGKTTFVDLVSGHLRPEGGTIRFGGEAITRASPTARVRRGLVRSFQVTRLFATMTPEEHVALALLQREGRAGWLAGDYRRMPGIAAEARDILELLQLAPVAGTPVHAIAYGQQRLLELALALALKPRLLLLDEPAAGVPPADMVLIERALAQLPAELAIVMIEHDMDFVFRFARRVIVLAAGAVIFDGTAAGAAASPEVRAAYLGSFDAGSAA